MTESHDQIRSAATKVKNQLSNKFGNIWLAMLIRGLVAITAAICIFVWPQQTVLLLVKLLGAYLIIDALLGLVSAVRTNENRFGLIPMVAGILVGIVLLFWSDVSVKLFLVLVGVWLAIQGLSLLWSAMTNLSDPAIRRSLLTVGLVQALIGIILAMWPSTGVVSISWLLSLCLLALGSLLIFLASVIRKASLKLKPNAEP